VYQKPVDVYIESKKIGASAVKRFNKESLVVTANGVEFEADTLSINYMSSAVAVANFKYNQLVAGGMAVAEAYTVVYKSTIGWKNAQGDTSTVQIETIAEALELAMGQVGNIIGV
jgi:hypothetical protein